MDTRAKTSHEHGTRTHPRRTLPLASASCSFCRICSARLLLLPLLVLTTFVSLARAAASGSAPTLNLPHVPTTCDILNLTWTGGTANYTLQVTQARTTVPVQTWTSLTNTSVLWTVNVCGGKDLSLTLTDAGGYKSAVSFAVQYGTDGSCLSQSQRDIIGCVISASATSSGKSTSTAKSGTNTGSNKASSPRLAVVVGVVVAVAVLMLLFAVCMYRRRRQRRGTGVLGPGSRPYFVRHERDPARRRNTLLDNDIDMPPPTYQDARADRELLPDHSSHSHSRSHSSSSPPLSAAGSDPTGPLIRTPEPQTIQMAQLPTGRVEPELLPTPFLSSYEGSHSATTPSSEGSQVHARENTGATSRSSAAMSEVPLSGTGGEGAHGEGAGGDEPPPPYTLTV